MEEDGFAATKLFNHGYSYTYDDVIFLPHYIDFSTDNISLSTLLTRWVPLLSPILSSPMDTVTKGAMAAAWRPLVASISSTPTSPLLTRHLLSAPSSPDASPSSPLLPSAPPPTVSTHPTNLTPTPTCSSPRVALRPPSSSATSLDPTGR
ncbi:hypothetical protein FH972_010353 [Carpinus fangiana]|uniref:IMP dehydrogenase/GMP reductase domain-containing protein n=1 Tax=Carpinus fangiana TaxID=176857 RepID=A0A660KPR0_9ROSI|nr:hypothetical protein FH972_010353 [Carpinus fangiana]